jgi:hypothetical protein
MADEGEGSQGKSTEGEGEGTQTVTIEQFEELKKQLEDTKSAQSGSDAKVTELTKVLKEKEAAEEAAKKAAEEGKKSMQQKNAEELAAIREDLAKERAEKQRAVQRSKAIQRLSDKGIKAPKYLDRLIGQEEEETNTLIDDYIEEYEAINHSVAEEFAKANGRTVQKTNGKGDFKTIGEYTDAEIDAMSDEEYTKIVNKSKKT